MEYAPKSWNLLRVPLIYGAYSIYFLIVYPSMSYITTR